MKKLFLLQVAMLFIVTANAQYAGPAQAQNRSKKIPFVSTRLTRPAITKHSGARITTTAFVAEDFSSGTATALPAGWSTGAITAGTWKWTNTASSSAYTMGAMASSSAGNGWMVFDSDSTGTACSCMPAGWLQSPPYDCSAHPHVRLNFQDYFRKLEDTCYVWVSTSPSFSTYTSFPVWINNELTDNTYSANPENVQINISSAAGSHAAVYIRFVTRTAYAGGSYSWMIDDMTLSDPDSVDIGISKSAILYNTSAGPYTFGTMPSRMAPSIYPQTFVANYGFTDEPSLPVNAQIFQGSTNVYNTNVTVNAPVNAYNLVADFSTATPPNYYSNTIALYTVPLGVNPDADAIPDNNADTLTYMVSDSIWSENPPIAYPTTSFYVYEPGSQPYSFSPGTQFLVPDGQSDTLTSVSVAFGGDTKAGQVAGVHIYHFDVASNSWFYDGRTQFRALSTTDISTPGSIAYATFNVDEAGTGGKIILQGGLFYGAVVKGYNNTDTVTVLEGNNPASYSLIGYTGLSDTSDNAGSATQIFQDAAGNELTPFINLNFGPYDYTGITQLTAQNHIGSAFPNPANTAAYVPFTLAQDAVVTAILTDVTGQKLFTQHINATAGKATTATFPTTDLPDGIYLYTLQVNGQNTNGRIVVAH